MLGMRSRIPAIRASASGYGRPRITAVTAVDGGADHGDRQVAEHVAGGRLDDPIRDLLVALPPVAIEQAPDPVPHARFIDQAEERQEGDREDERDRPEGGDADVGHAARCLADPAGDLARVRLQGVERVAAAVDQAAEVAVPALSTSRGRSSLKPRTASTIACSRTSTSRRRRRSRSPAPAPWSTPPGSRPAAAPSRHHRRENGDAEDGDEDQQQDVPDRGQRPGEGDRDTDEQDRPDWEEDINLAAARVPGHRGGF